MHRYEFVIKKISNGWIFIAELPEKPRVEIHFTTEVEALTAMVVAGQEATRLAAEQGLLGSSAEGN